MLIARTDATDDIVTQPDGRTHARMAKHRHTHMCIRIWSRTCLDTIGASAHRDTHTVSHLGTLGNYSAIAPNGGKDSVNLRTSSDNE